MPAGETAEAHGLTDGELLKAAMPFIVLIAVVVLWTGPWSPLPKISLFSAKVEALSSLTGTKTAAIFNFAPFIGGSALLVACSSSGCRRCSCRR